MTRTKEEHHKYYLEHKEEINKRNNDYYSKHREQIVERCRKYRVENREKIKTQRHERYETHKKSENKQSQKNYEKHKERILKQHKERRASIKLRVLTHYGGNPPHCQCKGCYYLDHDCPTQFLTIDHINNDGAEHRKQIGEHTIYHWLIKHNFPEGYQVLCMNCNWAKRLNGVCPHENK
jgi:hypothetical protein